MMGGFFSLPLITIWWGEFYVGILRWAGFLVGHGRFSGVVGWFCKDDGGFLSVRVDFYG